MTKTIRSAWFFLTALAFISCVEAAVVQGVHAESAGNPPTAGQNSLRSPFGTVYIFAYPGSTCPPGSDLYRGPETSLAKSFGAVYCRFKRSSVAVVKSKTSHGTCPPGLREHTEANIKPDDGFLWCDPDPNYKPVLPPLPVQPSPK